MTRRLLFRWLHVAWAIPCLVASIVLAGSTGGHPPGFAFLPLALIVWLAGHAVLALAQHLIDRGAEAAAARGAESAGWPWYVVLTLVASGVASAIALLIVGRYLFERDAVDAFQLVVLGWMALHIPCFTGVALRRPWARHYAAATALAWALLMLAQMAEYLWYGKTAAVWEWSLATAIVLAFSVLAWLLWRGGGSRRYFGSGAGVD